jgi:hypothetical protein
MANRATYGGRHAQRWHSGFPSWTIKDPTIRYMASRALDRLSPDSSLDDAQRLEANIDKNRATEDRALMASDLPLKEVMLRMRSRAAALNVSR